MGKSKTLIIKTATAIAVSGIFLSSLAVAQSVGIGSQTTTTKDQTTLPPLAIMQYDNQTLLNAGCDPAIMGQLNQTYYNNRNMVRNLELQTLVREQVDNTPKPRSGGSGSGASCYQQAADNINSIMNTAQTILDLLSGTPNFSGLMKKAGEQAMNMACNEVSNYTGAATGSVTQSINGTVGGALNQLNGYQLGSGSYSTNVGTILSGTGYNTTNVVGANNVPYVTSGQIAGVASQGQAVATQAQSSVSNWATQTLGCNSIATCTPFK